MDTKMQKKEIHFSRHRNNGTILDFIVKALEIEQKDERYQKIYQRFVKENAISVDEYNDTLNTVLEDLLYNFFDNRNENNYQFIHNYIKELLSYYSKYKLYNETLATSQKQLDFLTIRNFFLPFLKLSIEDKKTIIIIEMILPDSTQTSFQKLFSILEKSFTDNGTIKKKLYALLNEKAIGHDAINKSINNWVNGKTTPNKANIKVLVNLYRDTQEFSKKELNLYFNIAKILDYFYKKSVSYFGKEKTILLTEDFKKEHTAKKNLDIIKFLKEKALYPDQYIKNENQTITNNIMENRKKIDALYKITELETLDINFFYYSNNLDELLRLTHPKHEKTTERETRYKKLKTEFKNKYNTENDPYFQFIEARYFAQNREYKKAIEYYLSALTNGKNIIGKYFRLVCEEGLIVSSLVTRETKVNLTNAKTSFTKFYKEAYFYGGLQELPQEKSEYFLNDMKKKFDMYFTNLYVGIKQGDTNIITPNFAISSKNIKIAYKNPNKFIKKDFPNPITQIMYSSSRGNYESTVKLIKAGADVNILKKSDNSSALICAMQSISLQKINPNNIKIIKLLIPKMSQTALNAQLIKEKETALSYAINLGLPNIVKLLIKNGVDINQKATLDVLTPLYLSIQCIHRAKEGIPNNDTRINSKFIITDPLTSKEELKKLAKSNKLLKSVFDEDRLQDTQKILEYYNNPSNERHKKIKDEMNECNKLAIQNNSNQYNEIFDILLQNTQDVDITNGSDEITPLIFATEINNEKIVRKLLDKGANPDRNIFTKNGEIARAYDYAEINKNEILMGLLE